MPKVYEAFRRLPSSTCLPRAAGMLMGVGPAQRQVLYLGISLREFTFYALGCIRWCKAGGFSYRLISTSNTHASNKATRVERTMPATSQYRPSNPPTSTMMPATTDGSVAI